jgi:hypothetical protein
LDVSDAVVFSFSFSFSPSRFFLLTNTIIATMVFFFFFYHLYFFVLRSPGIGKRQSTFFLSYSEIEHASVQLTGKERETELTNDINESSTRYDFSLTSVKEKDAICI